MCALQRVLVDVDLIIRKPWLLELAPGLTQASTVPVVKSKILPVFVTFILSPMPSKFKAPPDWANNEVLQIDRNIKRKANWRLFFFRRFDFLNFSINNLIAFILINELFVILNICFFDLKT